MIDLQGTYNNTKMRMSPFVTTGKLNGVPVYFPAIKCTVGHVQHAIRIMPVPFFKREEATRIASPLLRNGAVQDFVYRELQNRIDEK